MGVQSGSPTSKALVLLGFRTAPLLGPSRAARYKRGNRTPEWHGWHATWHTYGTFIYDATKNLKLVMESMGHSDPRTAMRYQHPEHEQVRIAIEQRNAQRHNSRHSPATLQ